MQIVSRALWMLGKDPEEEQLKYLRGFPPSDEPYLLKFRIKPSTPLIKMIIERTKRYTHKDHLTKIEPYTRMCVALTTNGFFVPGYSMVDRSYWLCPIVCPNKELFK